MYYNKLEKTVLLATHVRIQYGIYIYIWTYAAKELNFFITGNLFS